MSLVLVADDEPAVLEVLSQVVEDLGHEVIQARDGDEALVLARARRPHLVVTDHMMPRLSGLELVRQMARDEQLRGVPVILMSAVLPRGAPEAKAFLPKPFEISDFEHAVALALTSVPDTGAPAVKPPDGPTLGGWLVRAFEVPLGQARGELRRSLAGAPAGSLPEGVLCADVQLQVLEALLRSAPEAARLSTGTLSLERTEGDLCVLLHDTVEAWRQQPRAGFPRVSLRVPSQPVRGHFDAPRLGQLLSALLLNASRRSGATDEVRVELQSSRGLATLRVADRGAPISAEELSRLFEPFRDGASAGGAASLELYVASELARLHGGGLAAEATAPRGMAFSVVLPAAA